MAVVYRIDDTSRPCGRPAEFEHRQHKRAIREAAAAASKERASPRGHGGCAVESDAHCASAHDHPRCNSSTERQHADGASRNARLFARCARLERGRTIALNTDGTATGDSSVAGATGVERGSEYRESWRRQHCSGASATANYGNGPIVAAIIDCRSNSRDASDDGAAGEKCASARDHCAAACERRERGHTPRPQDSGARFSQHEFAWLASRRA